MSSTISTLKKKFLSRRSNADELDTSRLSADNGAMEIGTPTNVKRLIHAETDENGILRGLPPEYEKMLEAMTTAEERMNPDNASRAKNVIIFFKREAEKKDQPGFIRTDFMIGSSGESSVSAGSGSSGRNSSEELERKDGDNKSTFYVNREQATGTTTAVKRSEVLKEEEKETEEGGTPSSADNANVSPELDNRVKETAKDDQNNAASTASTTTTQPPSRPPAPAPRPSLSKAPAAAAAAAAASTAAGGEGEATLRRKGTTGATRGGPRVTRNITEEEVYSQLNALCSGGHPLDRYERDIELGSGAAGTVFLASDKQSEERVAIKIIDLQKQPKKEMILMELKVRPRSLWCWSIRCTTRSFSTGDEGAPPPEPGELHRVLHGGGPPVGGDGVPCRGAADRRRH